MDFVKAWEFVNEHLYFAKIVLTTPSGKIYIENKFEEMFQFQVKKKKRTYELWVEFYTTDEELLHAQHDYSLDFSANTYEEAVCKIADWIFENFGNAKLNDYFVIDKKNPELLNGTLNEANKNHWDLEKIKLKKQEWYSKKTTPIEGEK